MEETMVNVAENAVEAVATGSNEIKIFVGGVFVGATTALLVERGVKAVRAKYNTKKNSIKVVEVEAEELDAKKK